MKYLTTRKHLLFILMMAVMMIMMTIMRKNTAATTMPIIWTKDDGAVCLYEPSLLAVTNNRRYFRNDSKLIMHLCMYVNKYMHKDIYEW